MDRLSILVGQLYKSVPPTKYFFKVQLVGRFIGLVGMISRSVDSPLHSVAWGLESQCGSPLNDFTEVHMKSKSIIHHLKCIYI